MADKLRPIFHMVSTPPGPTELVFISRRIVSVAGRTRQIAAIQIVADAKFGCEKNYSMFVASFLGLTNRNLFVKCKATAMGCWGEDSDH